MMLIFVLGVDWAVERKAGRWRGWLALLGLGVGQMEIVKNGEYEGNFVRI